MSRPTIPSTDLHERLQAKIDGKTKPPGALGRLEELAMQIGLLQQTTEPEIRSPLCLVFAGDHGITEEAVSAFPAEVTYQMVLNFLSGGAAINVFARQNGLHFRVVDAGVKVDFEAHEHLIQSKIAAGTANFLTGAAMTVAQCDEAIAQGRRIVSDWNEREGTNLLICGEMGIGNTTTAAAILHALSSLPGEVCVGRGTGVNDEMLQRKIDIVQQAVERHGLQQADAKSILRSVGGFEIAMMTGAYLEAAERRILILVDGFIATAAALLAVRMRPRVKDAMVFAHKSDEKGHAAMLDLLGASPLLDLGLRLGEGTGAALAYPIVLAAVNFVREMSDFASANVSEKTE
jgi:nicotinate-nucleotide--dimethylbenzimidazole phosphoribosyltransferase